MELDEKEEMDKAMGAILKPGILPPPPPTRQHPAPPFVVNKNTR
jgi:hypothetical protein